jgi:hypothetical protein
MLPDENGYSRDEIFEQLKKIAAEEERLYGGQQMSFDFSPKPPAGEEQEGDPIGNTQELIDEQAELNLNDVADGSENPVLLRKLWNGAQGLILANIPKGKTRRFVLDEKKLFLQASANTTDSKFTLLQAAQTAFDLAENWVQSNADAVELGMAYWDLNERNGFHVNKKQSSFNATLKALLNVPPPHKDKK